MSGHKIDRLLDAGRRALNAGKLAEASSLFDRVLQTAKHPEALHLKGATLIQQGQVTEAVALIEQAAAHDARADYFCDLGTAYFILCDSARAEAAYRQALALVGDDPLAEVVWADAIDDPTRSQHERQDLIEDLNEVGFADPAHPTADDLPLIANRLALIEELAPYALDDVNAAAFAEAYKDLMNMYDRALRQ